MFIAHELFVFIVKEPAPTYIYALSLHDALPISVLGRVERLGVHGPGRQRAQARDRLRPLPGRAVQDRKSTRLNSSHLVISYAVFCLKKKNNMTCIISD